MFIRQLVLHEELDKNAITQHHRPKKQNIDLNKRIQSISCITNIQELCDLIRSSSAEFNHVKVATALRKGLQEPRRGVSPEVQWVSALSLSLSLSLSLRSGTCMRCRSTSASHASSLSLYKVWPSFV
jgi:hypothetical protein